MPPPSSLGTTIVRSGRGSCGPMSRPALVVQERQVAHQRVRRAVRCGEGDARRGGHAAVDAGQPPAGHHLRRRVERAGADGQVQVADRVGRADEQGRAGGQRRRERDGHGGAGRPAPATTSAAALATRRPASVHAPAQAWSPQPSTAGRLAAKEPHGRTRDATWDGSAQSAVVGDHLDPYAGVPQHRGDRPCQRDPSDDEHLLRQVRLEPAARAEQQGPVRHDGGAVVAAEGLGDHRPAGGAGELDRLRRHPGPGQVADDDQGAGGRGRCRRPGAADGRRRLHPRRPARPALQASRRHTGSPAAGRASAPAARAAAR